MTSNSKDLVSVIINCRNGEKYLTECIDSVIKQSFTNWEIIFFDNLSTDKSLQIAKSFNDKRIKFFYSKKDLKLYEARNEAIKCSNGQYITFLDTDDFWDQEKLLLQIQFLQNNKLQICYSNYFIYNQNSKKKKLKIKRLINKVSTQDLLNDYNIGVLTAMIDKRVFENAKFDKSFEIIGDFDFFIKISLKTEIGFLNKILANYRVHNLNISLNKIDEYYSELKKWISNNGETFKKNNLSLTSQKIYLFKLWIKKNINFFSKNCIR